MSVRVHFDNDFEPAACPYTGWNVYGFVATSLAHKGGSISFGMAVPPGASDADVIRDMEAFFNGSGGANFRVVMSMAQERAVGLAILVDARSQRMRIELAPAWKLGPG